MSNVKTQHKVIFDKKAEILSFFLQCKNKKKTGDHFGISAGGVDSALASCNRIDLVSPWYRKTILKDDSVQIRKRKNSYRSPSKVTIIKPKEFPKQESQKISIATVDAIARELLVQALNAIVQLDKCEEKIKKYDELESQFFALTKEKTSWKVEYNRLLDLVAKANEEKDRLLKIHNTIIMEVNKNGNGGAQIPTVENILEVLRRRLRPGDKL